MYFCILYAITIAAGSPCLPHARGYPAQPSSISNPISAISYQLSATSYQLSVISYQLSAISYQLSAISYQLSAISYQLSAISYQLSAISYQLSAISYQLSATALMARERLRIDKLLFACWHFTGDCGACWDCSAACLSPVSCRLCTTVGGEIPSPYTCCSILLLLFRTAAVPYRCCSILLLLF